MKIRRNITVEIAFIAFFAMMPLLWVSIGSNSTSTSGGVKPVEACFALVAAAAAMRWGWGIARWPNRGFPALFVMLYGAGLVWSGATLIWGGLTGAISLIKAIVYFGVFLCTYGAWRSLKEPEKRWVAEWGSVMGLTAFFAVAEWTFWKIGRNYIGDYVKAIATGNVEALQFDFYPKLFNFNPNGSSVAQQDANFIGTSLRNTLVGAFVMYFFLLYAYSSKNSRSTTIVKFRIIRLAFAGLATLLVITAVSRSNWIAFAGGLAAVWLAGLFKQGARSGEGEASSSTVKYLTAIAGFLSLAAASIVLMTSLSDSIATIIESRLGSISTDGRISMYSDAISLIELRPMLGYGVGSTVVQNGQNLQVHNCILGAWYETGIVGGLLAFLWWIALACAYFDWLFRKRYSAVPGGARIPWICALPVLPLVRTMVAGDGGGITLIEWVALAIFFAETATSYEGMKPVIRSTASLVASRAMQRTKQPVRELPAEF